MVDLGADHCVHRVLVAIPVLPTAVDYPTVRTLNHIPVEEIHTHTHKIKSDIITHIFTTTV